MVTILITKHSIVSYMAQLSHRLMIKDVYSNDDMEEEEEEA